MAGLRRGALEAALALGRAASGPRGPLRPWRERQLAGIFASDATLRLQFPREDLGFTYGGTPGAAVYGAPRSTDPACQPTAGAPRRADVGPAPPGSGAHPGLQQPTAGHANGKASRRRGLPYVPTTEPGARMPHADITVVTAGRPSGLAARGLAAGALCSTLDLVPLAFPTPLLLLGQGRVALAWAAAALEGRLPVSVAHVCADASAAQRLLGEYSGRGDGASESVSVAVDASGRWGQLREVSLLSRGHVEANNSLRLLPSFSAPIMMSQPCWSVGCMLRRSTIAEPF